MNKEDLYMNVPSISDIFINNNIDDKVLSPMEAFNVLCEKNNELWKKVDELEKRIEQLEGK